MLVGSTAGSVRELDEDWADGRVMDSFFMLRRDRGLLGEGRIKESASEVVEERVDAEAELSLEKKATPGLKRGVSMRRGAGGPFLRGGRVDCGRGVAASMLLVGSTRRRVDSCSCGAAGGDDPEKKRKKGEKSTGEKEKEKRTGRGGDPARTRRGRRRRRTRGRRDRPPTITELGRFAHCTTLFVRLCSAWRIGRRPIRPIAARGSHPHLLSTPVPLVPPPSCAASPALSPPTPPSLAVFCVLLALSLLRNSAPPPLLLRESVAWRLRRPPICAASQG